MNKELLELLNRKRKYILINLKNPSPAHKSLIGRFIRKEMRESEKYGRERGHGRT